MSGVLLISPPDQLGYGGPSFKSRKYDLPMPTLLTYGSGGWSLLRESWNWTPNGANLSAAALPDQGCRALHHNLQAIVQSIMKLGRIQLVSEAVDFLIDKVGEPYKP